MYSYAEEHWSVILWLVVVALRINPPSNVVFRVLKFVATSRNGDSV